MDRSKFGHESPGDLVEVTAAWGRDAAFVPQELPPDWVMPSELWPILAEAKMQLGLLEGLGRSLPNPAILLRPTDWSKPAS